MTSILLAFQWTSNTGYAIGRLEPIFARAAERAAGHAKFVHFAYPRFKDGPSRSLPSSFTNFAEVDVQSGNPDKLDVMFQYIRDNDIGLVFAFDLPPSMKSVRYMRAAGVGKVISYWGAPISTVESGLRLLARRIQYRLRRNCPDHYIFETEDMKDTATHGLGVPSDSASVVPMGVDVDRFRPSPDLQWYAHDAFGIPRTRKIVYYSGHMESRKGVGVIVRSAVHLMAERGRRDLHFLFLGNKNGEERAFDPIYCGTAAEGHITFAGYRHDVEKILPGSYIAVIASTGWDSHTMTALEASATGVPLVVSNIPGLRQAISEGTGVHFKAGDHVELAARIAALVDSPSLRDHMSQAARERICRAHTVEHQVAALEVVFRSQLTGLQAE